MSLLTTHRRLNAFHRIAMLLAAAAALTACGRPTGGAEPISLTGDALAESGPQFLAPPLPSSAVRLAGGEVEIVGRAPARAVVTLRNPDGQAVDASAGADGSWVVHLPASAAPRLFALSAALGDRRLKGEGALLQAPAPAPPAMLLRAGAASLTLGEADGALSLDVFDFDGAGGLAIAGRAPPQAGLRLTLDGRPAIAGQADAKGRFALMAVQGDLQPGRHALHLEAAGRAVDAVVDATPSSAAPGKPYQVRPVEGGWRVDWATPGGGSQSSVIFAIGASGAGA